MTLAVREQQEQAATQNKVRQASKVTARLAEAFQPAIAIPQHQTKKTIAGLVAVTNFSQ